MAMGYGEICPGNRIVGSRVFNSRDIFYLYIKSRLYHYAAREPVILTIRLDPL
jgi:hypothetical protein